MDCGGDRVSLASALAPFDEAALAALANKGIVRRAARDVAEGKAVLVSRDGDAAEVAADGETVRIDAGGPTKARCTCPAPGICRHKLAAILLLQAGGDAAPAAPGEDRADALIAEIAAIPEATLRRFAGRAGWRAALELAEAGAEIVADGTALVIRLAGEEHEVRYLGGLGIDGMVSKASPARRKPLHAAALIAVRLHAGVEPDAAPAEAATPEPVFALDPAFLAEVRATLAEACRSALSFAPVALEERLFTLSVSSRADALPRLGAILRAIARAIRERRTRSFRFDPDRTLDLIATADAIARALPVVADPAGRAALLGTARQVYGDVGALRLHGLGAETWAIEGGGRGVTAFLYAPDHDRWFTLSLARGAGQDPTFDPARAFASEAVLGAHTLASLSNAELAAEGVAASPQGRLSLAAGGRIEILRSGNTLSDDWPCAFTRWSALAERLRAHLAGRLTAPAPMLEPVILRPRRTDTPWFDDLAQTLCWPVEDEDGTWIALSVPHNPDRQAHSDHVASLLTSGFGGAIVVAATIAGPRFDLRPIALADANGIRSLDFDRAGAGKTGLTGRIAALWQRGRPGFVPAPKSATIVLLDGIANELTGIAEMGCRALGSDGDHRLAGLAERASRFGLDSIAGAVGGLRTAADLAPALLAARYRIDQLRRQMTALPLVGR